MNLKRDWSAIMAVLIVVAAVYVIYRIHVAEPKARHMNSQHSVDNTLAPKKEVAPASPGVITLKVQIKPSFAP